MTATTDAPAVPSWKRVLGHRKRVDLKAIRGEKPVLEHGPRELPLGSVVVDPKDNDRILLAYLPAPLADERGLRRLLMTADTSVQSRTGGLLVRTATFGALPRLELRGRDWCRPAGLNEDNPDLYAALAAQAAPLEQTYEGLAPGLFDTHTGKAEAVLDDWRLPGSRAFTGGVVNRDSNIGYHFDTGNFTDVWSAMICLRRGMDGGALVLPELGMHLPIADGSVTYFDGQGLLHGVTDMAKTSRDGYRFTVVYYSTKRLWACLPPTDELARAKAKRTERAQRRAGLIE